MKVSIKREHGTLKIDIGGTLTLPKKPIRAYLLVKK